MVEIMVVVEQPVAQQHQAQVQAVFATSWSIHDESVNSRN
jgi:hypothetical protein